MHETTSSQNLANNLVALRGKRKLSQQALATKANIPRSTVALLESGQSNPTLQVMLSICNVLNVGIDEILAFPRGDYKHIKASDVPRKMSSNGDVVHYKLLPDAILGVEIDRMELKPRARKRGIPHLEYTKEYLTCLSGTIRLYVDNREFNLSAGDVLAFPGDKPHSYVNAGTKTSICLSVVIPVGRLTT